MSGAIMVLADVAGTPDGRAALAKMTRPVWCGDCNTIHDAEVTPATAPCPRCGSHKERRPW